MRTTRRLGLVLLLILTALPVAGQDARVRVAADTSLINVGDPIQFVVSVEHRADQSVTWPDSLDLGPFEILGAQLEPSFTTQDGQTVSAARFALTAFELGELEIPSFTVTLNGADGSTTDLETDAWGVEVVSVGLDEGGELRGIKGPMMIALSWLALWPWFLLLAGALALAVWGWRRRGKGEERDYGPVVLQRPPHEVAYEAFEELASSDLLARGEIKEFHVRASEIVRIYVEGRYGVDALEMTTAELNDALWRVGIEGELLERFRYFGERADMVKFAKFRPDEATSLDLLQIGRSIIDDTKPRMVVTEDESADASIDEPAAAPTDEPIAAAPATAAATESTDEEE